MTETNKVLTVDDLHIEFVHRKGNLQAIRGVSFDMYQGEILGMVGESGAGKSLTGSAITGLIADTGRVKSGEIYANGRRIDNMPESERRLIRGKEIAAIFQDPLTSLNPVLTIEEQLVETIQTHLPLSYSDAFDKAVALMTEVGIPAPMERIKQYPHQFSGGMRQRIVIALALCVDPSIIIADEPTTALDVSVQSQVLQLMKRLCKQHGASVLLVTHDMGVIAEVCDRVAVMYAGELIEIGAVKDIIKNPKHPYTRGLMDSIPKIGQTKGRLYQIEGAMPRLNELPKGCKFNPRCEYRTESCTFSTPKLVDSGTSKVACNNISLSEVV